MAILVGIDETSGTQSGTQGSATANDVSSSLPEPFATALSFETKAGSVDPVSATALSGATTSTSTGSQVISFTGSVTDVKFTDSTGAALAGQDSGILTTGGREIFLYTSSHDNNVLLGREGTAGGLADPGGAVAFALYLDTGTGTSSDVGATGAKLWMTQFEAIHQDSATNTPNDFVSLLNDLFVSVNTLQDFSLSGAPSGNNLFLMFGDGSPSTSDVTIVVTGKNPADQSAGANVSTGDTVVTSQGGVGDTTIGTNNQMVDPGEGVVFTFVKGANPDFTIPNLSPTEANVEANIQFTQSFFATSASFLVSQLQPPKGVTLMLTAVNDPTIAANDATNYVNDLHSGDEAQVNINTVTVTRTVIVKKVPTTTTYTFTADGTQSGISVDFSGNTAKVTGLVAGDRVGYVADGNHDRLIVDNVGNTNANLNSSFDIGGFRLESGAITTTDLGNVAFIDDAPTAGAALGTGSVAVDETAGVQGAPANDTTAAGVIALFSGVTNTSTQLATAQYAQGSASVIDSSTSTFGADGQAASNATVYSLDVATAGVDSKITTDDGSPILLYKEGSLVVGRIGSSSGAAAFAVSINSSTGVLSMAQYSAVHQDGLTNTPNDSISVDNTALQAVVTVTDGDGDQSTASVNVGNQVTIYDDGPALAFGNLIGTGTINPQYGAWSMSPGADGLGSNGLDIAMTSFQLVKPDNTVVNGTSFTFSETAPSPDSSGNYHFSGSVTGDLDNNAATADTTEHFTMTAFANGTYNIDLVEGFQSTTTESTANGTLGAGGPDAVQTLTVGTDHIVFFSAVPTASASDLITYGTELGAPDFTEAQLEAAHNTSIINFASAMNVSTSGIGDANNNLQGDSNAAIGSADESFVANPGTQFTSAKVFIDNSVQGYSYSGGERLYYRILYIDGTDSGQVLVTQDLGLTNKGQPASLTVDGGGKLIDAIQLTMATGVVKIPEIQFITQTNNLADGLKLGFTASIADGDGDTASSSFTANLSANSLGTAFDYVLNGTASALDWFNIDLTQSQTKYQVNGFDTGTTRDKLVLLGDAGATFSIDTSTADSVVTVHETGGQTDTVTVVGVHLLNSDVALA